MTKAWDYELIVTRRHDPGEKYKATRMQKFKLENGKWTSLGAYLHW